MCPVRAQLIVISIEPEGYGGVGDTCGVVRGVTETYQDETFSFFLKAPTLGTCEYENNRTPAKGGIPEP
jgi:hypothetical protein